MEKLTVAWVAEHGLCISCGLCRNVCPQTCITYRRKDGIFQPETDAERCTACGICAHVCPGLGMRFPAAEQCVDCAAGNVLESWNA